MPDSTQVRLTRQRILCGALTVVVAAIGLAVILIHPGTMAYIALVVWIVIGPIGLLLGLLAVPAIHLGVTYWFVRQSMDAFRQKETAKDRANFIAGYALAYLCYLALFMIGSFPTGPLT